MDLQPLDYQPIQPQGDQWHRGGTSGRLGWAVEAGSGMFWKSKTQGSVVNLGFLRGINQDLVSKNGLMEVHPF